MPDNKMLCSFRTQFNPHERVLSNPGTPTEPVYEGRLDEHGDVQLVQVGERDIVAEIQSHRDSVDIHVLMQRYQDGDIDVLSRVQGIYGDFTEMPKSYAELLDSVVRGEQMFDSLPAEVKHRFDDSFSVFMAAMDKPDEFFDKLKVNDGAPAPEPVVEKEVESE